MESGSLLLPEAPLELQIALDLVAGPVNRRGGPGRVASTPQLGPVASRWLDDPVSPTGTVTRLFCVFLDGDGAAGALAELAPGGVAGLVTVGGIGRVIDRLRGRCRGCWLDAGWLRSRGLELVAAAGVGGPAALGWALAAQRAARGGSARTADRLERRYRSAMAPHSWPSLADVAGYVVRRPG